MVPVVEKKKKRGRDRSGIRFDREADAPQKHLISPDTQEIRTAKALQLVYRVILPRMHRCLDGPRMARASYNAAFVLDLPVFRSLAKELGEAWTELVRNAEYAATPLGVRLERRHMEDAAEEIVAVVDKLPKPQREVVIRKAAGMSWKRIVRDLPNRAFFSMEDDYSAALGRIWVEAGDAVRRLI